MVNVTTIREFFNKFSNDNACLDFLMKQHHGDTLDCPKCGRHGKFHRVKRHPAYECAWCGYEIYPMAGTIFHRSHTPLQKWFYAIYLFTTMRHGISAKELQRQLGVTYPTAWRMAHEIRKYMAAVDGEHPLKGDIEADETYTGGKTSGGKRGRGAPNKTVVFGMLERGGDVMTHMVPDVKKGTLHPIIADHIETGSTVHTDELSSYMGLSGTGYTHRTVNHGTGEYVNGSCHVNGIDGFWARLKLLICGTHVHVSEKYLQHYAKEFEYRYNRRHRLSAMFGDLVASL